MSLRALYLSGAPRLSTHESTESLGPRSHILGVISAFRNAGIQVDELIVGNKAPAAFSGQGAEAKLSKNAVTILATDLLRLLYRFRNQAAARRALRSHEYDFAYERYALFQSLGSVRQKSVRWVLEVNALLAVEATSERRATTSRAVARWVEGRTFRKADQIVAVTASLRDQIAREYGVPPERISVIQNGVTVRPGSRRIPTSLTTIGYVGALYEWQNLESLIEALVLPPLQSVRLNIAGDGPQRAVLVKRAQELGVAERVQFFGRIHPDEVQDFLSKVDACFAGHSSSNGVYFSPLKLWEYLAAGRVVVASRHETTEELERDGFAVITYSGDSAESVAEGLLRASDRFASLAETAADAVQRVRTTFSWDARLAPLVESLEQATADD